MVKPGFLLWGIVLFIFPGLPSFGQEKELQTIDRVYESNVKSVLLCPYNNDLRDPLQPSVIDLRDNRSMQLSFDVIGTTQENLYLRIENCYADWTLSNLSATLFMKDFNEFQILDRRPSENTRIPYVRYKILLPRLTISGNYLVVVYREGAPEDILLTHRMVVYETWAQISPDIRYPMGGPERSTHQQVDFVLSYGQLNLVNPMQNVKVAIRQNYSWNSMVTDLYPMTFREDTKQMEYVFFDKRNQFPGLNEFRFFDLRSLRNVGMNVRQIVPEYTKTEVMLTIDKPRQGPAYTIQFDIDGRYVPELYEFKTFENEPDYAWVTFVLETEPVDGRVFITGALSDFMLNKEFEMQYDAAAKRYSARVLLKQGYYDYQYSVLPNKSEVPDPTRLEGSYAFAQNKYEIFAYYRGPAERTDRVIGYKVMNFNGGR